MNTRKTGAQKEQQVCAYLMSKGVDIIDSNYRCRMGEVDLIGRDGEYLVFFEVKYRTSKTAGYACASVTLHKQKQICKVSDYFRMLHPEYAQLPVRYDVMAIDDGKLEWLVNAFEYCGRGF